MNKAAVRALSGLLHNSTALSTLVPGMAFAMASPADQIERFEEQREELLAASQTILDQLGEDDELTDEQTQTINDNADKVEALDKRISALKRVLPKGQGRRSEPEPGDGGKDGTGRKVAASPRDSARQGFRSFGEFAMNVYGHAKGVPESVQRMQNAASTYGNESAGADGGFLVPAEFSQTIMQKVAAEENLLNRAAQLVTGTNSMIIPKDENEPWKNDSGIKVYWEGEGAAISASKPVFETSNLRLVKLTALVPISEELLEDAIGLESWLRAKAPAKMAAKINTGFVSGTGVGQPLGILNAPSLISVAKETSQAADSILYANIVKMYSRMYAPWRRNAIWLINQDIEPQLDQMAFDPDATAGKVPVYLPPGGISSSPYASLKGRPVVPIEACSTLGDQGDIIFADMNQYWALTKAGGIRTDTSIHLYFDQALTTFRFIFRLNGQPAWASALQRENGSNTLSWAVTLDARG